MRKISIFVHSLDGGGAERTVVRLAKSLCDIGWKVNVLTQSSQVEDQYPLDERVDRHHLELDTQSTSALHGLASNINRVRVTRKAVKQLQPDVALSFMTTQNVILSIATLGLKTRVVLAERNFPTKQDGRIWHPLRRLTYRFASEVVAQTARASSWLERNAGVKSVVTIPNSVVFPLADSDPNKPTTDYLSAEEFVILAVGRNSWFKGFDLLLESFAKCEFDPNVKLAIAGLKQGDEVMQQASNLGIHDQLVLPGRVGNLSDWYQRADIFVLPSRKEGYPNVLMEAMAAGKCSIAFDCPAGPAELIEHGINGLLVPAGDTTALAGAISEAVRDGKLRERLGRSATQILISHSEQQNLSNWVEVLGRE